MATTTGTSRTTHLLALMKKGDDAFNNRDFATLNVIHHPDMVAYVTGNAEPIYGSAAHAAMVRQMFRIFPDVQVRNDPYPVQFGSGDWITVVTRTTGTFTGEMALPDGAVVPRRERRSTSTSARPASGRATSSSPSPPSGTPRCRPSRSDSAKRSATQGRPLCPRRQEQTSPSAIWTFRRSSTQRCAASRPPCWSARRFRSGAQLPPAVNFGKFSQP